MDFPRFLERRVRTAARHFPIVVVTGARQTGKTTLLRATFPEHEYVSLDVPSVAQAASREPDAFLRRHPPPILLDEVQYAPDLFRHIKLAADAKPRGRGDYVLTGSQKFALMEGVRESLAGRAAILDLEGLAADEIAALPAARPALGDVSGAMARGFLPALWAEPELPPSEFHASYVATCLERDVRQIVRIADLATFERFLRLCATRSGHLLSKADLARDCGVNVKTADAWLSVLQASNQVTLLPPWHRNSSKRLVKSPKLYLNDVGSLCWLLGLDAGSLLGSPHLGAVWETAVFAEIRKLLARSPESRPVSFYGEHQGPELDFVIERGAELDLLECRWTESPQERDTRGLERVARALAETAGVRVARKWLVTRTPEPFPLGGTRAVHGLRLAETLAAPAES